MFDSLFHGGLGLSDLLRPIQSIGPGKRSCLRRSNGPSRCTPKGRATLADLSKVEPNARAEYRRQLRVAVKAEKRERRAAQVIKGYVPQYVARPIR